MKKILVLIFVSISCSVYGQLDQYEIKYLTENGLEKLINKLDYFDYFVKDYAFVKEKNGKYNFINKKGVKVDPKNEVIDYSHKSSESFPKKYFIFKTPTKKFGLIDSSGAIVFPAEYDQMYFVSEGFINFTKNGKNGLFDSNLKNIQSFKFDEINIIHNKSLISYFIYSEDRKSHKLGVFDIVSQKIIVPPDNYERINDIKWALMLYKNNQWGLVDYSGKILIYFEKYSNLSIGENKFFYGSDINGMSIIDSLGNVKGTIPNGIYNAIGGYDYISDLLVVQKNNLYGAINIKNEIIIPIEYNSLDGFSGDGIARASKGGKTFFLSKKNYQLGDTKFNEYDSYRMYRNNDTIGYVDKTGQIFPFPMYKLPPRFLMQEQQMVFTQSGKWGFVNSRFKLVIDTIYDKLIEQYAGYFIVMKNNKFGVISKDGDISIPVVNDALKRVGVTDYEIINEDKKRLITLKKLY